MEKQKKVKVAFLFWFFDTNKARKRQIKSKFDEKVIFFRAFLLKCAFILCFLVFFLCRKSKKEASLLLFCFYFAFILLFFSLLCTKKKQQIVLFSICFVCFVLALLVIPDTCLRGQVVAHQFRTPW